MVVLLRPYRVPSATTRTHTYSTVTNLSSPIMGGRLRARFLVYLEVDDYEKQQQLQASKKKSKKKTTEISSTTDVVTANGTSSVDEAKTRLLQKNVQNIWTTMYPLNAPFLILNSAGKYIRTLSLTLWSFNEKVAVSVRRYGMTSTKTRKEWDEHFHLKGENGSETI